MPLNTPSSADEVIDRSINDVFLSLQEFGAKPALGNSYLNAIVVANANRVFDMYFALDQAALEALPDTAVDNLNRWGAIYKVTRTTGRQAEGNVIATGTVGSTIPLLTVLVSGDGFEYEVQVEISITTKSLSVASITRSGSTATLTTVAPHVLSDNVKITVTGADQSEYNVIDSAITVTGASTLTYTVTGTPVTATGTILLGADTATMEAKSVLFSEDANTDPLAGLTFESPIIGVDEDTGVDFSGMVNGSDQEEQEAYRARVLDRIQNPVAHFNTNDIVFNAKQLSGVTRVFVEEITPAVGQVTVYFMRDEDDTTAIPSAAEVIALKTVLDLIRPANTKSSDLIVLSPTAVPIAFTFTALSPSTSSMKAAVTANLQQFFKEETEVGVNVTQDSYRSVIFNTIDIVTGNKVQSFALSTPSGDVTISDGEIGTLGVITF